MADHQALAEKICTEVMTADDVTGFVFFLAKGDGSFVSSEAFRDKWSKKALREPFFGRMLKLFNTRAGLPDTSPSEYQAPDEGDCA